MPDNVTDEDPTAASTPRSSRFVFAERPQYVAIALGLPCLLGDQLARQTVQHRRSMSGIGANDY